MIAGGAISGASSPAASPRPSEQTPAPLRVALVGCGRRGRELIQTLIGVGGPAIRVVGLADFFACQVQSTFRSVKGRYGEAISPNCIRSAGSDCITRILESDADLVIVATPPVCRPEYFQRLVKAGKHTFLEKPIACDPAGIASMLQTSRLAEAIGLTVHVGFQNRYDARYRETVQRIGGDMIGTPLFARALCNVGSERPPSLQPGESRLESQLRNWKHFRWTGGDVLVEQHVSGLDTIRWSLGMSADSAQGQGGWSDPQSASSERSSDEIAEGVFDHHSVEFEFNGSVTLLSQCRRRTGAWNQVSESVIGTQGRADLSAATIYGTDGAVIWKSSLRPSRRQATANQLSSCLASVREGLAENHVAESAESSLMALMGELASRSGKRVRREQLLGQIRFGVNASATPVNDRCV